MNGTTGKPVAKAQVNYVLMAQGMKPAASQVTDNDGRFRIDNPPSSGGGPALLRVEYEGATYSHPVLPGQSAGDVEIQVFDASKQPGIVSVKEHAIFVHPSGNTLLVLEQVILGNESSPPKTYVNEKGTYPFTLPAKAREGVQVTVEGPGGMPISQPAEPRDSANSYEINYAIRPGETQVRLEYALDYHSPYQFSKRLDVLPAQLHIVTPGKDVQVKGEGLTPAGTDPSTGFSGFALKPEGNLVKLEISGEVPATQGEGNSADDSATLVPIPDPVSKQRWVIVSAAGLIMLGGLVYHLRRA